MKKLIFVIFVIFFIIPLFLISCDDDDILTDSTWKLERVELPMVGEKYDASERNILFEFKKNGILLVHDYVKLDESEREYVGFSPGNHSYEIGHDDMLGRTITIDNFVFMLIKDNNKLVIRGSYIDGEDYYFSKH